MAKFIKLTFLKKLLIFRKTLLFLPFLFLGSVFSISDDVLDKSRNLFLKGDYESAIKEASNYNSAEAKILMARILSIYTNFYVKDKTAEENFLKAYEIAKTAIKILPDETPEGESPIAVTFGETGSRLWKLEEIFEDEKPVVTFSKRIESQSRAQSNPIILSSIFPSIIEKLLDFIWETNSQDSDSPWIDYFRKTSFILELDWPDTNDDLRDVDAKKDWIERFVNSWTELNYEITTHRAIKELDHVTEGINEIR